MLEENLRISGVISQMLGNTEATKEAQDTNQRHPLHKEVPCDQADTL